MGAVAEVVSGQLVMDLTAEEQSRLERCERVIAEGRKTFLAVGNALTTIRDERLYRATHRSFEEYLREKWDIGKSSAYRLMDAAEVVGRIEGEHGSQGDGDTAPVLPANEAQARPLTQLPAEEQPAAWREAVEASGGQPTGAAVQEVVDRRLGREEGKKGGGEDEGTKGTQGTQGPTAGPAAPSTSAPAATGPAAAAPAPAVAPTAAAQAGAKMSVCLIPNEEAEWLAGQGLTPAVALVKLRELLDAQAEGGGGKSEGDDEWGEDSYTVKLSAKTVGRLREVADARSSSWMPTLLALVEEAWEAVKAAPAA